MNLFFRFSVSLFLLLGMGVSVIACAVFFLAAADPLSAKMADDNDPFGPPPSRISSVAGGLVSALVFGGCAWAACRLCISRPGLPGPSVR